MRARIDIGEVEIRTKIRAKYLRALENEEWELLPGPIYVKSFLRTYGDFLGLDTRLLLDDFKRRYEHSSDHELRPIASLSRERDRPPRGPLLPPWAIIGLVLAVVVVALGYLGSRNGTPTGPPTTSTHASGAHRGKRPVHRGASIGIAPPAPARPTTVKLELVPTAPLYVCLVNGAGKTLIRGVTFSPGQRIPTETARRLMLTLGNPSVQMKVNGIVVHVPTSSTSIGFLLAPSGNTPLPGAKQPRCA